MTTHPFLRATPRVRHLVLRSLAGLMAAAAFCAAGFFATGTAQAQEKGVISAQVFASVPERAVLAVRPLDNSDANLELKRTIENLLLAAGYSIQDNAPTVLSFDTRDEAGAWSDGGNRYILELKSQGDTLAGNEQQAKVNLFHSQQGGLFNLGSNAGTQIISPSRFEMEFTLDDRASGTRLWQAWGHASIGSGSTADIANRLARPMVGTVGRTVRQEAVELY